MRRLSTLILDAASRFRRWLSAATPGQKPTLLLHMGPHKTGSTAIQLFCERNREQLARAGFWYPQTGICWGQHLMLPATHYRHHPVIPKDMLGGDPQAIIDAMLDELPTGHAMLLSSEVFWELFVDFPDAFAAIQAMLSRSFRVHLMLVQRPDCERLWSGIKHVARIGVAIDAVAGLRDGQEACRQARARLATSGCPVIHVPYERNDCVSGFLESLAGHLTPRQGAQRLELEALVHTCRATSTDQRENVAPMGFWCAAFTLEFSRRLFLAIGGGTAYDGRIEAFLREVIDRGDAVGLIHRLPDEDVLLQRVMHTGGKSTGLLTPVETRAWESICEHPVVQFAARKAGCIDELNAVRKLAGRSRRVAA